jgi:diguanylate cyclase (GGDEF)-like protein
MHRDFLIKHPYLLIWFVGLTLFLLLGSGLEWLLFEYQQKNDVFPADLAWPNLIRGLGWLFAAFFAIQSAMLLKLRRKLSSLALFDPLTGLPGRPLFLDRLKQTIRRYKRNNGSFSIVSISVDDISLTDNPQSHKVKDMMLEGISRRLLDSVRYCDTVAHWKSNSFLVLLDACQPHQARFIAENLRRKIELPVSYGKHELRMGASIGLANYPEDGRSLAALLKIAYGRMAKDKRLRQG